MGKETGEKGRKSPVRRVEFATEVAGNVQTVILTGDFTGWTREGIRLTLKPPGRWSAPLSLAPGEYQYRLLIDGVWSDDPKAIKRVPNAHGTVNCLLVVP